MIKNNIIYMSDTVHGTIQISEIEKKIISTQIFNRLHNISQNSTAYLTFSTNRTKRFEHSIGTMHLAGKMFYSSIANADAQVLKDFFEKLHEIINKRIDDVLGKRLYKYEVGDKNLKSTVLKDYNNFKLDTNIKNIWLPSNIEKENQFLYIVIVQSIRLSALLHDVGHPPFSHIAENAMKSIWREIDSKKTEERTKMENQYYEILEKYFENNGELHEQIGNTITDRLLQSLLEAMPRGKENDKEVLANQIFLIMIKEVTLAILNEKSTIFKNLHKLIDGSLDCDRLDYVTRDVLNSGFNNGIIEYERLISSMKLMKNKNEEFIFCPQMKVLNNVEDFFGRRWNLYKQIIFHHRVIKTDYLLNNCIQELISKHLKTNSEITMQNNILPYDISGLWLAVQGEPSDDVFFNQLIQWDDSWLMVVLKKEFLSIPEDTDDLEILRNKLNELLANKKYYYSVIKKPENFIEIEESFLKLLQDRIENLENLIIEVKESKPEDKESETKKKLVIDPFIEDLEIMIHSIKNYEKINFYSHSGFILSKIKNLIFSNYLSEEEFNSIVSNAVKESATVESNIKDVVVEFKNIKLGVQEGLSLYSSNGDIKPFRDVSNIVTLLLFQREFLPGFYIYISKKDIDISVDYKGFKEKIGHNIAIKIIEILEEFLLQYK